MKHFVADTHALLFYLFQPRKLSRVAGRLFAGLDATAIVHVSTITLWETALLHEKGYLHLDAGFSAWKNAVVRLPGVQIEALTGEDVDEARVLAGLADPFDRLIAGTARRLGVPLISKDQRIQRDGRVKVIW